MNTDEIKKRLARMNGNSNSNGENDGRKWKDNFWKPEVDTKTVIRLLNYKHNDVDDFPFKELKFYFGIGNRRILSLVNFDGEADPILEFAAELKKTNDEKNKELAKKLYPKLRVFAPVIVRGEEDKGVRMWEFGYAIYTEFLQYMDDEDYGDIADVLEGRDITVESISAKNNGTLYPSTSIRIKPKTTPLSKDVKEVEDWVENQPDLMKLYTKVEYDDMKKTLQEWIEPKLNGEDDEDDESTNYSSKEDVNEKVEAMFDKDDE